MNYYARHIGDYTRDAAHLSLLEHGVYCRLLDTYYAREQPLPSEIILICRLIGAKNKDERAAVEAVLKEFFTPTDDGWKQARCDKEIERFNEKSTKAKRSANARWSQSEGNANAYKNAMRSHSEGNAPNNQEPITNKYPPNPRREKVHEFPPGFDQFWEAYPRKTAKPAASRVFTRLRVNTSLLNLMLSALERQKVSEQWTRDHGQYVPHPATWLNNRRWEDELAAVPVLNGFEDCI